MTGFALMSMFLNSRFMLEPDTVNPDLRKFYEQTAQEDAADVV